MLKTHADMLAWRVREFLGFLEPDSLIDQATDARLRQQRELAEHNLRAALAEYDGTDYSY